MKLPLRCSFLCLNFWRNFFIMISMFQLIQIALASDSSPPSQSSFQFHTQITSYSSFYRIDDPLASYGLQFDVATVWKALAKTQFRLVLGADKELVHEKKLKLKNGYIGAEQIIGELQEGLFKIKLDSKIYAPLNKEDRRETSFITKLAMAPIITLDLMTKRNNLILKFLKIVYAPYFARSFYRYSTTTKGASNSSTSLEQQISMRVIDPQEKWDFNTTFIYNMAFTKLKNRKDDQFELTEEFSLNFPKNFSLTFGHSNSQKARAADGVSNNIRFHDPSSSSFYTTISNVF